MHSRLGVAQPLRAVALITWMLLTALAAATPVLAQGSGAIVLRVADTTWLQREVRAGRFATAQVDQEPGFRLVAQDNLHGVRPGQHRIRVTMPGYAHFSDTVRVEAGATVLVTVQLELERERVTPVAAVPAGAWVRLRAAGARTEGQIAVANADTLFMTGQPPLRLAVVDSLWVRKSSWRRGGTIGAIVGGVLMGAFAYLGTHWEGAEPGAGGTTFEVAVAGAAGGFLLGAAIGAAIPHWELRSSR